MPYPANLSPAANSSSSSLRRDDEKTSPPPPPNSRLARKNVIPSPCSPALLHLAKNSLILLGSESIKKERISRFLSSRRTSSNSGS